jgi:putative nucleotidyltransferase with HDIG domain
MMDFKKPFARSLRERGNGRDRQRGKESAKHGPLLGPFSLWEVLGFLLLVCVVSSLAFLGQSEPGLRVVVGQPAPATLLADETFEYPSQILAQRRAVEARLQEPPVFRRTDEVFERFEASIQDLLHRLTQDEISEEQVVPNGQNEARADVLGEAVREWLQKTDFAVEEEALRIFVARTSPRQRAELLQKNLDNLRSIHAIGIYADAPQERMEEVRVIQVLGDNGSQRQPEALSQREAQVRLRVAINAIAANDETARALFALFRVGISPNLRYSRQATEAAISRAISRIEPPVVRIRIGEPIIQEGVLVEDLDLERYNAFKARELALASDVGWLDSYFISRFFLTFTLLLSIALYLKLGLAPHPRRARAIGIALLAIFLNLALIRVILELGGRALFNSEAALIIPFLVPVALGPILLAVLIGPGSAVMSGFVLSMLFAVMLGGALPLFLGAFLSGLVAALLARNVCLRGRLVRASLVGGVVFALFAGLLGFVEGVRWTLVSQQMLAAVGVGLLTGVAVIGLLPLLEKIFNVTTEITLLELTDFNHPLLRRMQLEAPGTYHHSLMVSNLSENAAAAIGASPLVCRACSLYHDIGKLVKPEYFVENQRGGVNPHDNRSPSMSALVIKAHVKEGVDMARRHKLPGVIRDVIRQHHGQSLIQYFYMEAKKRLRAERSEDADGEEEVIDESTYRYDGPKPQFKESAIIFFADSVEAASRSLKKATTVNIEELVEKIIQDRVDDGQLDECPLTFQELKKIRASFVFTILNMLHSRIEYPKEEKEAAKNGTSGDAAKSTARGDYPAGVDSGSSAIIHPVPQATGKE